MSESGWTIDTLKEHFEGILEEKDKAINIALAAAKEAVQVAEANAEKWRDNANEWRGAMSDREKSFATKAEMASFQLATEKALMGQKELADEQRGARAGIHAGWGYLVAAVGLLATMLTVFWNLKR